MRVGRLWRGDREVLQRVRKLKLRAVCGAPPYGYRREGRELRQDPFEQSILAKMREWRAQGWSQNKITRELNSRGVPTPKRARAWYPATVKILLRKPTERAMAEEATV
jgi:hypothetical protein